MKTVQRPLSAILSPYKQVNGSDLEPLSVILSPYKHVNDLKSYWFTDVPQNLNNLTNQ